MGIIIMLFTVINLFACGPLEDLRERGGYDLSPPVLISIVSLESGQVVITFDEESQIDRDNIDISPPVSVISVESEGNTIVLTLSEQAPGQQYKLSAVVQDRKGNSTNFLASFYGYNPNVPDLKINEFTCRGSAAHPDKVEIKAFSDGYMGGIVLYQGTPSNWRDRLIFPNFSIFNDDFIVVHFKPQGIPEEIDETEVKNISGGLDASDTAFDFWIPGGTGISGNNGVLALYNRPGGSVADAVLYSNRTSLSDEIYMGFGTRDTMERALELVEDDGWIAEQERVRPEDGINPEGSTATRSICRQSIADTDTRHDWYIVPTRKASFGAENSDEIYTP
jgi:hypothetical protein